MTVERRAEGLKNGAKEGTEPVQRDLNRGEHQLREPRYGCREQKRCSRGEPKATDLRHRTRTFRKRAMYEDQTLRRRAAEFNRRMRKTARPVVWEGAWATHALHPTS